MKTFIFTLYVSSSLLASSQNMLAPEYTKSTEQKQLALESMVNHIVLYSEYATQPETQALAQASLQYIQRFSGNISRHESEDAITGAIMILRAKYGTCGSNPYTHKLSEVRFILPSQVMANPSNFFTYPFAH